MEHSAQRRIAVIGDGIVAQFSARAVSDAGHVPVVFSPTGQPAMPPKGAFYLHDLPQTMRSNWEPVQVVTAQLGDQPEAYTQRMWGEELPSSTDPHREPVVSQAYEYRPGISRDLLHSSEILVSGMLDAIQVLELLKSYDGVVVTAPISFHADQERPRTKQFLTAPAQSKNRLCAAITLLPEEFAELYPKTAAQSFAAHQSAGQRLRELQDQFGPGVVTLYSADPKHIWLRVTQHDAQRVDLELPWDLYSMHLWRSYEQETGIGEGKLHRLWQEMRTSLKHLRQGLVTQHKIHPNEDRRNVSPDPRLLLTGRWATWERSELSHESYARVAGWLESLDT